MNFLKHKSNTAGTSISSPKIEALTYLAIKHEDLRRTLIITSAKANKEIMNLDTGRPQPKETS